MRIQLKPGLPVVVRGPGCVQIGLDRRHGRILDGLTDADLALVRRLTSGVDETAVLDAPRADPARVARARLLVKLLTDSGVLLRARSSRAALSRLTGLRPRLAPDAAAWSLVHPAAGDGWDLLATRSAARIEVHGGGRTALALAGTLAAAGVTGVRLHSPVVTSHLDLSAAGAHPDDVGLAAPQAARNVVARALGHEPQDPRRPASPSLVVLVDRAAADASRARQLVADDVPHLSVVIRETSIVVGPLVRPGQGPCLRCLDLHRSDRDRQWPMILAQLLGRQSEPRAPREESTLAQLAASLAALQVLGHLAGQHTPAAVGATLEVELPDGLVSRRSWPAHPACGCHWPPAALRPTRADDVGRAADAAETMLG